MTKERPWPEPSWGAVVPAGSRVFRKSRFFLYSSSAIRRNLKRPNKAHIVRTRHASTRFRPKRVKTTVVATKAINRHSRRTGQVSAVEGFATAGRDAMIRRRQIGNARNRNMNQTRLIL